VKYYKVSRRRGNFLHTIQRRKVDWIGHIWRRNCLLKHVIGGKLEGRIEMAGRRRRRCKQLLDDLKEKIGYWKWKAGALGQTLWRTPYGRGCGLLIRCNYVTVYTRAVRDLHFCHLGISSDTEKWGRNFVDTRVD
jgi:hypothetical protein